MSFLRQHESWKERSLNLMKSKLSTLSDAGDKVELAFGELDRVFHVEVDAFKKIMHKIRNLESSWKERIQVTFQVLDAEVANRVIDTLSEVERLLIDSKGSNCMTSSRMRAMDHLQDIPLMMDLLNIDTPTVECSLVGEDKTIVRRKEVEEIATLLVLEDSNLSSPVSVLPIYGTPGTGKTSLVYLLYHHQRVNEHFNHKGWLSWEDISRARSREEILRIVEQAIDFSIKEEKYLFVVEDLSNEDSEKWFDVLEPLLSVFANFEPGNKIIVTSRSTSLEPPRVLFQLPMAKGAPCLLGPLHHNDSLALFQSIAFKGKSDKDRTSYMSIALEINNKCADNLHVITFIASILSYQPLPKWQYFNEVVLSIPHPAKHILSILDLMPQHLKYYSLFPLDYIFSKIEFYELWDAQHQFTEPLKEKFERLLRTEDLFECCKSDKNGDIVYYKVQALVHEVAKHLARDKHCLKENATQDVNPDRIRHASFIIDSYWEPPVWLGRAKQLESLFFVPRKPCKFITIAHINSILSKNKVLQALDLAIVNCSRGSLDFIGKLNHLRYLKLGVSSNTLPECITNLMFLQTLDLRRSKVEKLPEGFYKLSCLRHLYIGDRLIDLPPRFGELTHLQTLDVFIVGQQNGLDALANFTHLAGTLKIRYQNGHEEHVIQEETPSLEGKKLHELLLEWPPSNDAEPAAKNCQDEVDMELELLQPPSSLETLTVKGWKGERFPQWAIDHFSSLLSNLVFIHIADCSRCKHLPSFYKLRYLKSLELSGLNVLEWIEICDDNIMVSTEPYFTSLEHLSLLNLPMLKGWSRPSRVVDHQHVSCPILPRLYDLRLSNCPELISLPLMPNLQSLEANNCHRYFLEQSFSAAHASPVSAAAAASPTPPVLPCLRCLNLTNMSIPERLDCLTSLEELSLCWLYNLRNLPESIGHLIQLRRLVIRYVPNLADLPESLAALSALEHVEIRYCPRLKKVAKYFSDLKSLQRLEIKECVNLERRCQQPDGEDWPLIQHIPNVTLG